MEREVDHAETSNFFLKDSGGDSVGIRTSH